MFCVWPVHILKTIHKFLRKAVYRFPISACPYTNRQIRGLFSGPEPSKMCMKRKELTVHTQRVSCLLRNMAAAFTRGASHLLRNKPIALTKRACCSATGAPALADGDYLTRSDSCRAARPAGRPRSLTGERTGMYRGYMENAWRMYGWCNI